MEASDNRLNDRPQKTNFQSQSLRCSLINESYGRRISQYLNVPGQKKNNRQFARYFHWQSLRSVSTTNSAALHHGTGSRNKITRAVNDIRCGLWDWTNLITSRSHRSSFHLPVLLFSLSRSTGRGVRSGGLRRMTSDYWHGRPTSAVSGFP